LFFDSRIVATYILKANQHCFSNERLTFIGSTCQVSMGEETSNELTERDRDQHVEHLIGELKRRSSELEEANRELKRISHYRSLFLARMSHELRTPLTSILGFAEILLDHEDLTETQERYCQKIRESGHQLQASLEQLVDLTRVEAGQTELFLEEFSLPVALRDCCERLARLAQRQQLKIDCEVAADLTNIVSDQGRLRQIIYSFLAWCVSRSRSEQSINVHAMLVEPSRLRVTLADEGERVENLLQVFDPRDTVGSGELPNIDELGIIVGRRLVEIMGGFMTIENRAPGGVLVTIELPVRAVQE
jgi:signal transduction histidine kinase